MKTVLTIFAMSVAMCKR